MWNENHSINYHSAQFLAGQFFPEDTFTNTNKPGTWHKQHGARAAAALDRAAGAHRLSGVGLATTATSASWRRC